MTPLAIIQQASADGVNLTLSATGTIKVAGDQLTVNRWLPILSEHKPGIVAVLQTKVNGDTTTDSAMEARRQKVISKLEGDPGLRYAMEVHDTPEPEAVILSLAIRGKGACELRIPKSRYDAFVLLELLDNHTAREKLQ